jgi:hypothetical protein
MNSSASVWAVPVIPDSARYSLQKFWIVIVATVCVSFLIGTRSFASTAWCSPSDHCRPSIFRPVFSSTMITSTSPLRFPRSTT